MRRSTEFPELLDPEWLRAEYAERNRAASDIAAQLGCTTALVHYRLRDFGIPRRGRHSGRWRSKHCQRCGAQYMPTGTAQRFCSAECRLGTRTCEQCGETFAVAPPQNYRDKGGAWHAYPRRFCSHECLTAWRGENCSHRWVNGNGYVEMTVAPTLHRDINSEGYVRINLGTGKLAPGRVKEHRWVMEQRLGRLLLSHEEVHHKNGIKTDNDRCQSCPEMRLLACAGVTRSCPECGPQPGTPNLELWSTSQPRGQRVEDKIAWARGFLAEYGYQIIPPSS